MNFRDYLKKLEEDPVIMYVGDEVQDMDTGYSFTFGALVNNVYIAGYFGSTLQDLKIKENDRELIEVVPEIKEELEPLIAPYVSEDKSDLDRFLKDLTLKPISFSAKRFEPYHDFISEIAQSILFCRKLIDALKANQGLGSAQFSKLVKDTIKEVKVIVKKNNIQGGRSGLKPAGRIFGQIKGISFYGPKPSKRHVVKILGYAGIEDVSDYTIEYEEEEDKWVQVTMDSYNEKTVSKSSDRTEKDIADIATSKQRKPIKLKPGEFRAQKHYERGNRGG